MLWERKEERLEHPKIEARSEPKWLIWIGPMALAMPTTLDNREASHWGIKER